VGTGFGLPTPGTTPEENIVSKETPEEFAARRRAEHVEALRVERAGYERYGDTDRVKLVDAEIAAHTDKPRGAKSSPKRDTNQPAPRDER